MLSIFLFPLLFSIHAYGALLRRQFPSLIVPLDKRNPDWALGTQKTGRVEHSVHTEISFDVPSNAATFCKLSFTLNTDPRLNPPASLWGVPPYRFNVSSLERQRPMNEKTDTWNNHPRVEEWVGQVELSPGPPTPGAAPMVHVVRTTGMFVPCWKGQLAQYILYPDHPNRDFGFSWFELDYDPPHGITYEMWN